MSQAARRVRAARGFYAIIIAATGIGTLTSVYELTPIRALVWSTTINGVISVPIRMVMIGVAMMWIGQSPRLMGELTTTLRHRPLGWAATGVMAIAAAPMLFTG